MNFSSVKMKALTAAVILAATTGVASAKSYKGENYKGEAMAAPCPPPPMLKDGWYLGAQGGYESYRVRASATDSTFGSDTAALAVNGWLGGLFLGYGQYVTDMFYLGGEIFGNYTGAEQRFSAYDAEDAISVDGKFESRGNYGLALLPGIRLNNATLGYLRFGWNWASFKSSASVSGEIVPDGKVSTSRSHTSNGFNLGLGLETLVYDNWSVRTEYSHTWYNDFSRDVFKFKPSDNQFFLGVLYHFA